MGTKSDKERETIQAEIMPAVQELQMGCRPAWADETQKRLAEIFARKYAHRKAIMEAMDGFD